MNHAVAMRIANRVADLADEAESNVQRKRRAALAEEMIETNFVCLPAEENGRAQFMFVEVKGAENAGMIERFENLKFLEGRAPNGFVGGFVFARNRVKPDASAGLCGGVLGLKILVGDERILFDQFLQNIVPDSALTL